MRINASAPELRRLNFRADIMQQEPVPRNLSELRMKKMALARQARMDMMNVMSVVSALHSAKDNALEIEEMLKSAAEHLQLYFQELMTGDSDAEAAALILNGNTHLAYVGEPYGTHIWDPVEGVFIFVGSGGTHGVNFIMLLLGEDDKIEVKYDDRQQIATSTPKACLRTRFG